MRRRDERRMNKALLIVWCASASRSMPRRSRSAMGDGYLQLEREQVNGRRRTDSRGRAQPHRARRTRRRWLHDHWNATKLATLPPAMHEFIFS
jgi:hypothetical protein